MRNAGKKSHAWTTLLTAFIYSAFVIFVGISAAIQGLSNYYVDLAISGGSVADADTAISLQQSNPNGYTARGKILLQQREFSLGSSDLETAVSLRPRDYQLWLQLGKARSELGDISGARSSYQQAILLAPLYSQPNYDLGMLLLKESKLETAFEHLRKSAESDPELYPEILQLAWSAFPNDAEAIESSVQPKSKSANKITARFLIDHDLISEKSRSFLMSDELTDAERNEFVEILINERKFRLARQIWQTGRNVDTHSPDEPIFDGGFEMINQREPGGFGWQIDQKASAISVSLDEREPHSGSRALIMKFNGNVEVERELVSQLVDLEPNEKFELRFFARSTEFISASIPVIVVKDRVTNEILARSAPFTATRGQWFEYQLSFSTKSSSAVTLVLLRPRCNVNPCPIFGDLSLDDFSIRVARFPSTLNLTSPRKP